MGRPAGSKNKRRDDQEQEDRGQRSGKDDTETRDTFENEMFADSAQSPLYIAPERWPDGMALRWVRLEAGNAPDTKNWSKMTRVGWTPVKRDDYDDLFPSVDMPGVGDTSHGVIIYGGLCLCQRPMQYVLRDKKRQENETLLQGQAIQSYVEGGNPNAPRAVWTDNTTRGKQMHFKE